MATATASEPLMIQGKLYSAERISPDTIRLVSPKGDVYDVTEGPDRATCDCPSFTKGYAGDSALGCKHIQACVISGRIVNNAIKPEPDPVPPVESKAAPIPAWGLKRDEPQRGLSFGKPEPTPVALTEKYRPRTLADIRGQGAIVFQLTEFLEAPHSAVFMFQGNTGTGKTSTALAFAAELGCVEFGGLYVIKSGDTDSEALRDAFDNLRFTPMLGSGWKVVVIEEADGMSPRGKEICLSALEDLPPRSIVIMTTDHAEKFPPRFLHRCERFQFADGSTDLRLDAQLLVNDVWYAETGRTDAPRVDDLPGAIEDGAVSFRACVQALNPLIRRAKRTAESFIRAEKSPEAPVTAVEPVQAPADVPVVPVAVVAPEGKPEARKRQSRDSVDWQALAARVANGATLPELSAETGIPKSTLSYRIRKVQGHDSRTSQSVASEAPVDANRACPEVGSGSQDGPKLGSRSVVAVAPDAAGDRVDVAPSTGYAVATETQTGIVLISVELSTDDDDKTPPTGPDGGSPTSRSAVLLGTSLRTAPRSTGRGNGSSGNGIAKLFNGLARPGLKHSGTRRDFRGEGRGLRGEGSGTRRLGPFDGRLNGLLGNRFDRVSDVLGDRFGFPLGRLDFDGMPRYRIFDPVNDVHDDVLDVAEDFLGL